MLFNWTKKKKKKIYYPSLADGKLNYAHKKEKIVKSREKKKRDGSEIQT